MKTTKIITTSHEELDLMEIYPFDLLKKAADTFSISLFDNGYSTFSDDDFDIFYWTLEETFVDDALESNIGPARKLKLEFKNSEIIEIQEWFKNGVQQEVKLYICEGSSAAPTIQLDFTVALETVRIELKSDRIRK